ncbi:hypothetical protein Esti_000017 [Eimeria stiedai]
MEAVWGPPPPLVSPVAGGPGSKVRNYEKLRPLASCSKSTVWLVKLQQQQNSSNRGASSSSNNSPRTDTGSGSSSSSSSSSSSGSSSRMLFAMKEVPLSSVKSEKQAQHLWKERECLEALRQNPYLQAGSHELKECFKEDAYLYFVFQFLPGGPLYKHIRASGALKVQHARWYAAELTETLGRLHAAGWTHRDLQASNVILSERGRPLLIDFGFATKHGNNLQRSRSFCGTLHAMAPEVFSHSSGGPSPAPVSPLGAPSPPRSGQVGPRVLVAAAVLTEPAAEQGVPSQEAPEAAAAEGYWGPPVDWWGLGVLLYECLCGTAPFGYKDYEVDSSMRIRDLAEKAPFSVSFPEHLKIPSEAKDIIRSLLQASGSKLLLLLLLLLDLLMLRLSLLLLLQSLFCCSRRCTANPNARLGATGDAAEVKRHPFFAEIPWSLLEAPPGSLSVQQVQALSAAVPQAAAAAASAAAAAAAGEDLLQPQETLRGFRGAPWGPHGRPMGASRGGPPFIQKTPGGYSLGAPQKLSSTWRGPPSSVSLLRGPLLPPVPASTGAPRGPFSRGPKGNPDPANTHKRLDGSVGFLSFLRFQEEEEEEEKDPFEDF